MYISSERHSFTYRLSQISEQGCDAIVRERLVYALSCLRQYAELDGEDVWRKNIDTTILYSINLTTLVSHKGELEKTFTAFIWE